jgi:transcriptional regulator with XRE-family HTH domain
MNIELYKKVLKEKRMTYEDLAKQTGLSLGCVKRIMAGIARYPRADTIEAIEKALEINTLFTSDERSAGASLTKRITITPMEDDLIYSFRELGKQRGKAAQQAVVDMIEKMLN